ncbi:MAG: hypothetical protein CM15mP12_3870 [Gammaproteobacteria bacterium]|nr:MAG: hypothetical protein CM15mP12_3870 [Gammaproteobacteria bacterium]
MTPKEKLITVKEGEDQEVVKSLMYKHRIEKILVLDSKNRLVGLITMKDIEKSIDYPLASRDAEGRLMVGAAVGVGKNLEERAENLAQAGVDVFIIDSAHGDSEGVIKVLKFLKRNIQILTLLLEMLQQKMALSSYRIWADAIKVGVGPGLFVQQESLLELGCLNYQQS